MDYFQGNRTPYTDSLARGAIWGLTLHTRRAQIFRSLMEGIVFGTKLILDSLAKYGHATQELFACGGATRSALFMQIYADICGLPISVTQVADAPLLGDAILAFNGLGIYPDLPVAAQSMVKIAKSFVPNPANHVEYQYYLRLYAQTFPQLQVLMHDAANHLAEQGSF